MGDLNMVDAFFIGDSARGALAAAIEAGDVALAVTVIETAYDAGHQALAEWLVTECRTRGLNIFAGQGRS